MIKNIKYVFSICIFSIVLFTLIYAILSRDDPRHHYRNKNKSSEKIINENKPVENKKWFLDGIIPDFLKPKQNLTNVAIGCAITSHGNHYLSIENVGEKMPLLKTLVPSFCKTASSGYNYYFYVSYDIRDPCFIKSSYMSAIHKKFKDVIEDLCPAKLSVSLYFVKCKHNKNPAWAQNDAMMEAYLDHMDYYYRVNDDTKMLSPGWIESYIEVLENFNPPNVGVVGPLHKGGNLDILTYDFVHRTHIDIFGSYYPRIFTDWWADNWISMVYGPKRTMKLPMVRLVHTGEAGTRYSIKNENEKFLNKQVEAGKVVLERFLKSRETPKKAYKTNKIISMSLWGSKTRFTYGAMRNAQLMQVYFPSWKLRIYVEKPKPDSLTTFPNVDNRIINKLTKLGVEIIRVDYDNLLVPPMMWRYLVADDETVDVFIIRDADCRISDRDAQAVSDWLSSCRGPIHCIRDHPSQKGYPISGGLWGGIPKKMRPFLPNSFKELTRGLRSDYNQDNTFLGKTIWPIFQNHSCCHDSVSCKDWPNTRPFPTKRLGTEHLGQTFDAFGNAKQEDILILLDTPINKQCLSDNE